MVTLKRWKAYWYLMPSKRQQGILVGISGFNATMIAMVATSGMHGYWYGFLLGMWSGLELGTIILQIRMSCKSR